MLRRGFLGGTVAGVAGAVLAPSAARGAVPGGAVERDGPPLRDLPQVASRGGLLDYHLTVAATRVDLGGRVANVHTYNGLLPGPVLRIRPGDRLRLKLSNLMLPLGVPLNALPPMCDTRPGPIQPADLGRGAGTLAGQSVPGCLPDAVGSMLAGETVIQKAVTTNLHTHGLQVSPSGAADNVFVSIPPLGSHQYDYQIPADHPAGPAWYHPHMHGSTAHQAWEGLAGPIVVEGEIDEVPEIKDAAERILVLSGLWLDADGHVPTAVALPCAGPTSFTTVPAVPTEMLFTVNGQLHPQITLRPGEVQRWRILNADPHRLMWLRVEGHTLFQIGQDGIPFAAPVARDAVMLAPANRAEILIRGGAPGRYRIVAAAYDQGHPGGTMPTLELATLTVTGAPARGRLPERLVEPPRLPPLPVARRRTLVFSGDISGRYGLGVRFYIDGRAFDPERIDQQVQAGTVEEWTIVNQDVMQHPFHIHVNPFQVIDVQGIPPGDGTWDGYRGGWWDTFRIPPRGRFTMRTFFRPEMTGKSVYHCHMLPHEDAGMMGTVLIAQGVGR